MGSLPGKLSRDHEDEAPEGRHAVLLLLVLSAAAVSCCNSVCC